MLQGEATQPSPIVDRADVIPLIKRIEKLRQSCLITYYLTDQALMADDALPILFRQLLAIGKVAKLDLLLHSRGGATVVPWRIVQAIREFCKHFAVLVPYRAHSAATHLALGADEIVMGPFSELGPVDPFRAHPLLPKGSDGNPVRISVQDLKHVVAFIKREAGEKGLAGEAFAHIMSALFQHVHPLAIGAIEQSYELAKLITRKVLSTHMDPVKEKGEIEELADKLSDSFKEHTYQIGIREAEELGLKVSEAPDDVYEAMWHVLEYYENMNRQPRTTQGHPLPPAPQQTPQLVIVSIGHMDTAKRRSDCNGLFLLHPSGQLEAKGSTWSFLDQPEAAA